MMCLTAWCSRARANCLHCLGLGGPQLTTVAFNHGITNLCTTLDNNARDRLQFERDRLNQNFTAKHGDAVAQRMYCLCNVANDNALPSVHKLLAKSNNKSRDYAIINNLLQEHAEASSVNLTMASAPIATTSLVEVAY